MKNLTVVAFRVLNPHFGYKRQWIRYPIQKPLGHP